MYFISDSLHSNDSESLSSFSCCALPYIRVPDKGSRNWVKHTQNIMNSMSNSFMFILCIFLTDYFFVTRFVVNLSFISFFFI